MNCRFRFAIIIAMLTFSLSQARTRLLVEVSSSDANATLMRIQDILSEAASNSPTHTNIKATIRDLNECESYTMNTCRDCLGCRNFVGSFSCECP